MSYFTDLPAIRFEGPESRNPLAYRYYEPGRLVLGQPMAEILRPCVAYWHSFCWPGSDVFGSGTFERPWLGGPDTLAMAETKADAAFDFFAKLGTPYFAFHDVDAVPLGRSIREGWSNLDAIADRFAGHMERTGVKLLWGTANLFSHPRYAAGAATNPDPHIFAHAAAQVRAVLDVTKRLGGTNYVLWGGREGYETLLNTDLKRELDQLGRFLALVVEHKHRIGFTGTILIEPKPCEPTKHQYDFDAATVHGFLSRYDLVGEVKLNIEANHATLAGHSFEHEIAYALAHDLLGSLDINRGDPQNGWDTDQFPNDLNEMTLVLYRILQAGGLKTGGFNFDAKVRRQSIDAIDLLHAHVGGFDLLARALLNAERLIADSGLADFVSRRYAGWDGGFGQDILAGRLSLAEIAEKAAAGPEPHPVSGRQEMLENLVQRFI